MNNENKNGKKHMNSNGNHRLAGKTALANGRPRHTLNRDIDRRAQANSINPETPRIGVRTPAGILQLTLTALGEGRISEVVREFDADFTYADHGLNLEFADKGRLVEFLQKSREFFPDTAVEVISTFELGDLAIAEWTITATENTACGSMQVQLPISFFGVSIVQIRNDRIIRWSDYYDQSQSRRAGLAAQFTDWIEY